MSIRNEEIVAFTQQFASMINAGISLTNSLRALEQQKDNKELQKVIGEVRRAVEGGTNLSEAFAKHPKVFPQFFVSMVYAGEQGAGLPKVLLRIADHLEKEENLRSKVKGVFTYPIVVGVLAILIITFLIVAVAPVFADVYKQLRIALPWPTQLLLAISFFARKYWLVTAVIFGALYFYYRRLRKSKIGQEILDWLIMSFPLLGKVTRKVAVARFVRTLGEMLVCKVPLLEALNIADKVVDSHMISKVVKKMRSSVQTGGTITQALSGNDVFPPVVLQMTYAGEQGGRLGEMLEKCADNLDRDVEFSAKRMIVILEPSLTLILAGVVGFIALAIYLPMFDLMNLVSQ